MSLNDILGSAVSGLNAAQAGLRSVSTNIANANTPGYARERTTQSTSVVQGRNTGVMVGEPQRVADQYLEQAVHLRSGDAARAETTSNYLDRLQAFLGAPGDAGGLPAQLDAISTAAIRMTGAQSGQEGPRDFAAKTQLAIDSLKRLDNDVLTMGSEVDAQIGESVKTFNGLLTRVGQLNDEIAALKASGRSTAGPEGQRAQAIEDMSGLMAITARPQPDGRMSIDTASGSALVDGANRPLQLVYDPGSPTMQIRRANPDGSTFGTGETLTLTKLKGSIGGLAQLRDDILPAVRGQIGQMFTGIKATINDNVTGNGGAPLITGNGLADATVDAAATSAYFSGNAAGKRAQSMVDALKAPTSFGPGPKLTIERFSALMLGGIGAQAASAKADFAAADTRRSDALTRRDNFSGVNVDEELSQMVVLQNSYAASARLISTANQMYDTLLGMIR